MICPHCKMLTEPMAGMCEFCGEDVRKKPAIQDTPENRAAFLKNQRVTFAKATDNEYKHVFMFMPESGRCYHCKADVIIQQFIRGNDGSVLVTGCDSCNRSYVD